MAPLFSHPVSVPTLEQQALIVALLLLVILITKEIGDQIENSRARRLALAVRVALAPLVLVFSLSAGLMLATALR